MRNLLIAFVLMAVAGGALLFWMKLPQPDDVFVVLGRSAVLEATAGPDLEQGLGVLAVRLATNAEVSAEGTAPVEGRFAVSTWTSDETGQVRTRRIRFDPGPYTRIEQDVVRREILDGFGRPALTYTLRVEGALAEEGKQYAFYLLPTAKARGDPSTVACALDYDASSRILTLTIDEQVQGAPQRFTLGLDVNEDGTLTRHD